MESEENGHVLILPTDSIMLMTAYNDFFISTRSYKCPSDSAYDFNSNSVASENQQNGSAQCFLEVYLVIQAHKSSFLVSSQIVTYTHFCFQPCI